MKSEKIFVWMAITAICSLFLFGGCEPAAKETAQAEVEPEKQIEKPIEKAVEKPKVKVAVEEPVEEQVTKVSVDKPVTLALKFVPGDLTTYKVIIEWERSVQFDDPEPNRSGSRLEMTYFQRIKSVNSKGNATAQITIKELKYTDIEKNAPMVKFDSSLKKDMHNPMAKLIGENYTIEVTPSGEVVDVSDFFKAQFAIKSASRAGKAATALVQKDIIKNRHEIVSLPAADKNQLKPNDNWSKLKSFPFGMFGTKSFERTYTLKEVYKVGSQETGIVEMEGLPSTELLKEQRNDAFGDMADNTDTYTGRLKLDLTAGKVKEFREELVSQWVIVSPDSRPGSNEAPEAMIFKSTHLYSLERID
ncbi:MAG: hypothetical protein ACYS9Y_02590 [Planctomycetota bacterium]|jgi:hypothetical protein